MQPLLGCITILECLLPELSLDIDKDLRTRRMEPRSRSKRRSVTFRMPEACIKWLRVKSAHTGLPMSEILQCCITNAALPHLDTNLMIQISALQLIQAKQGKHRPIWLATSEDSLKGVDLINAHLYSIAPADMADIWLGQVSKDDQPN